MTTAKMCKTDCPVWRRDVTCGRTDRGRSARRLSPVNISDKTFNNWDINPKMIGILLQLIFIFSYGRYLMHGKIFQTFIQHWTKLIYKLYPAVLFSFQYIIHFLNWSEKKSLLHTTYNFRMKNLKAIWRRRG